ncbi:MAG: hypothetical protein WBD31_17400 [Rubripirellula sp.]
MAVADTDDLHKSFGEKIEGRRVESCQNVDQSKTVGWNADRQANAAIEQSSAGQAI